MEQAIKQDGLVEKRLTVIEGNEEKGVGGDAMEQQMKDEIV